jgi:riboflavin kinase/FMN adenylyltransferase
MAMGGFDGVHLGHQQIIARAVALAARSGSLSGVLTFDPLPAQFVYPDFTYVLTPLPEKARLLAELGVELIHAVRFDDHLRRVKAADFVRQELVEQLHPAAVVIGHDHRFGAGGEGDADLLCRLLAPHRIPVEVVPEFSLLDAPVRSTRVREHLLLGHVGMAASLLGRCYSLTGAVVAGTGTGHRLGFPTLNIQVREPEKLVPADGVYAVLVEFPAVPPPTAGCRGPAKSPGVLNIGHRPTFRGEKRSIEVHLIECRLERAPEVATVHFVDRIRPERRFPTPQALAGQIALDAAAAVRLLGPGSGHLPATGARA